MHKFAFRHVVCTTLMLLTFAGSSVKATDLYNTMGQSVDSTQLLKDSTWTALSFMTSATDFTITGVTIPVKNVIGLTLGNIQVSLYTGDGSNSRPNTKIGSDLGTTPVSGFSNSAVYQDYAITGLNVTLSPSTKYYVVISASGIGSGAQDFLYLGLHSGAGGVTTGSLGFSQSLNSGSSWDAPGNSSSVVGLVTAVPEPSTYALAAIATGLITALARRRKLA